MAHFAERHIIFDAFDQQLPADLGSALPFLPQETAAGLLVIGLLLWAVAIGYTLWRAPHRFEADAAYRRRVKYRGYDQS